MSFSTMSILLMLFVLGSSETCQDGLVDCPSQTHVALFPTPTSKCEGGACLVADCCREKACGDWLYPWSCSETPDSKPLRQNNCSGGVCDVAQCCFTPTTCKEIADYEEDDDNYSYDGPFCSYGLAFAVESPTHSEPCPGTCTVDRCCRVAVTCEEYESTTSACFNNAMFPIENQQCSGDQCRRKDSCCRAPKSCVEHDMVAWVSNAKFCGSGLQFEWRYEDFQEECPNGVCTKERCCAPTETCGQADSSMLTRNITANCHKQLLVVSEHVSCTYPDNCTESVCCTPAASCREYSQITTNCTDRSLYFDPWASVASYPLNASECCRPPQHCSEKQSISPDFCTSSGEVFQYEPCSQDGCDTETCCRPPMYCNEASSLISCGPFAYLTSDYCLGNCTAVTCCEPVHHCNSVNDLSEVCSSINKYPDGTQMLPCYPNCDTSTCCRDRGCVEFFEEQDTDPFKVCILGQGQFPQLSRECTTCSLDTCCAAHSSCLEAYYVSGGQLCMGVGELNASKACSGSECTPSVCCETPRTCDGVESATSWFDNPSHFCARDGFSDNFSHEVSCDGPCTTATCCQAPATCFEWARIKSGSNTSPCKRGYVTNYSAACQNGVCDEDSCCRPASTCGDVTLFCGEHKTTNKTVPCTGSGCNIATCCKNATTCAEDEFLCGGVGKINTRSTTPCAGGVCTVASCCRAPQSCEEVSLVTSCPVGAFFFPETDCSGSTCDINHCCDRASTCFGMHMVSGFCGTGFANVTASFDLCPNGVCSSEFCCRATPATCGEAVSQSPALCGGSVDFFKQCTGAQCTDAHFCCRPPSSCREAIGSRNVTCGEGFAPTALNQPSCPSGVCDATTCCKEVATCGDANAAVDGGLCMAPSVLKPTELCGDTSQPCDVGTCCHYPVDCGELTDANPFFCSGALPLVNEQATLCSPGNCTQAKCCRAPESCIEAYSLDRGMCSKQERDFNLSAAYTRCSDCVVECCIAKPTFAPTTAPTRASQPPSPSNNCPYTELEALFDACKESDFRPPHTNCTSDCKDAATSLASTFALVNVSSVTVCVDDVLASGKNLSTADRAYVIKQVEAKAALCGVPTTISASPIVSYSAFVLGLLFLTV